MWDGLARYALQRTLTRALAVSAGYIPSQPILAQFGEASNQAGNSGIAALGVAYANAQGRARGQGCHPCLVIVVCVYTALGEK